MFWQPHWRVILMLFGLYPTTLQDNICYLLQAMEQWNYGLPLPKRNLSSGHLKTTQRPQHCQRQWIGLEMIWLIWWLLIPMLIVSFMILKRAILSLNWKQLRWITVIFIMVFSVKSISRNFSFWIQDGPDVGSITKVVSHPTLPLTITAHEDRHIRFFDNKSGKQTHVMVAHLDAVTSLAIDTNGLYLISGSKKFIFF